MIANSPKIIIMYNFYAVWTIVGMWNGLRFFLFTVARFGCLFWWSLGRAITIRFRSSIRVVVVVAWDLRKSDHHCCELGLFAPWIRGSFSVVHIQTGGFICVGSLIINSLLSLLAVSPLSLSVSLSKPLTLKQCAN